jgi:Carboxypeptidase regulatory-like domain/TonB dependent receptor
MKHIGMSTRLSIWLYLLAVIVKPSLGQVANNTSLVGTVTDASGLAVSGAKVTAVNVATNDLYSATTNEEGSYSITFIREGTYTITVEHNGFTKSVQQGIVVENNHTVRTDISLRVGSVSEAVTVNVGAPPISTDDATVAETIDNRSVVDLPLNGRDALKLAATTSNVILGPKTNPTGVPPGEDFIGAGQREITNSLTLDGITIMNNLITVTNVSPNVDAVQEVQVQNGNYTAQYGSYMGVHVNLTTKSGTNELHGALFEFVRNDMFDARPSLTKLGAAKSPLHLNQFGAEVGGPIYLPKLYNGRNKTFFTASYEGLRQIQSPAQQNLTLTQAMRTGDFSALCTTGFNASGSCINAPQNQIHNPATLAPYPNNMIPSDQLSPVAQALLQYYPLPNVGTNSFSGPVAANVSTNQTLERIDQNLGDKIRLFVRYDWQNTNIFGGNLTPTSGSYGPANNRNIAVGYTHILSATVINDFRFGRNHLMTNNLNYWTVNNLLDAGTKLGIPNFNGDTAFRNPGIPDITVSGFMTLGNPGSNWYQDDTTWHGYDQVSYRRGSHNFMAGAEIRKLITGRAAANNPRGLFNFTGSRSGNAAADFMLGTPQNDITPIQEFKGVVAEWRDGFFVLDNWQVNSKLTLNYGVRYELPTVPYSVNGNARILNPQQTALIPSTIPTPGLSFINPIHDDWAPRLGFAYRVTSRTVVRGGAGIYYNPNQTNSFTLATTNPPFGITTTFNNSATTPLSFSNPTPGAGMTPTSFLSVFTENPDLPTPRMYQWNVGVERELWRNSGFELQYLGSHSLHLDRSYFNNTPPPGPGDPNLRRPNQLWGQIRTIQNDLIANYDGLTAILRQRMSHNIQVLASYTWSHTLDVSTDSNGGGAAMNDYDWRLDYGNANWDIRHRFVASFIYDLPSLRSSALLLRWTLGNWQANGIFTAQTGMPFNVIIATDRANVGRPNQRPNIVGAPSDNCGSGHLAGCIDPAAFAVPAPFTFGNAGRNILYGPGLVNADFSVFKDFPIKERTKFQFRAEMFNIFNHPNFGNPSATLNTGSFGKVTLTTTNNRDIQFGAKLVF